MSQSAAAFPAGTIISEGTLYADPKQISKDGKNVTIALKVKLNYREREGDELDAFFIDVLVSGSTAEHILNAGWSKFDRISFVGDFKGHRWDRKLEDGSTNEEQTITVFARQIGASPRFVDVGIEKQEYNGGDGDGGNRRSSRRDDDDDNAPSERSSRRSSRSDDDSDSSERSSRRSSRGGDDDAPSRSNDDDDAPERSSRRSSRRARDTNYED